MKSMTGYGRAEFSHCHHCGVIELSAVNKKGFEFLLHGPREWQFFEKKAQEIVRSSTERGRIRLSILLHPQSSALPHSTKDSSRTILEQLDVLKKICESGNVPFEPSAELVQRMISTTTQENIILPLEEVEEKLSEATQKALSALVSMRTEEGSTLAKDLNNRVMTLRNHVQKIDTLTEGLAQDWKERLLQRIRESGLEIDCENEAIRREFTVFSERSDISEEITRIFSHIEQLEYTFKQSQPIGRKLEFIVQEIGRELNTIGSKSQKSEMTNQVISAKVEIEKIREQILNIE